MKIIMEDDNKKKMEEQEEKKEERKQEEEDVLKEILKSKELREFLGASAEVSKVANKIGLFVGKAVAGVFITILVFFGIAGLESLWKSGNIFASIIFLLIYFPIIGFVAHSVFKIIRKIAIANQKYIELLEKASKKK